MPVDKFGHTDSGSMQRVVAGGVTLTQVNNTFARLDGTNALTGNLNLGGNTIEGLSTTHTQYEDNDLTNKKYVNKHATRDYVSGMRASPGNLVRNTTSGIIYRFEGTSGIITAAPALSPNWRPTTGAVICSLRETRDREVQIIVGSPPPAAGIRAMHDGLIIIALNTDSAYTTANGLITIPRSGEYRLTGFVNISYLTTTPTPSGTFLHVFYTINESRLNGGTTWQTSITLPCLTVSLTVGDRVGIRIRTNLSCKTGVSLGDADGCGLQVEFLY